MSDKHAQTLQELWQSYLRQLSCGNILEYTALPPSPELNQAACRYMLLQLAQAYTLVFNVDPDHPQFLPYTNEVLNIGGPNPDAVYYFASISPGGTYRIVGRRNNVHLVDLATGYGYWGFPGSPGKTFPSRSIDEFKIDADGRFELLLSAKKPEGYDGNWMQLDPLTDYIFVRQVCYSWAEQDTRMAIERVDVPGPKTELTAAQIEERFGLLIRYYNQIVNSLTNMRYKGAAGKINALATASYGVGALPSQVYHQGMWQLAPGEALLCEVKLPQECFYWNIQAANAFWSTLEMSYRQSSINGHQAVTDDDGMTRVVIAAEDPGIPNWLDTGGLFQGDMVWRWLKTSSVPEISVRKVTLAKIDEHLPRTVKRISAEERRAQLRQRAIDAQLRRKW